MYIPIIVTSVNHDFGLPSSLLTSNYTIAFGLTVSFSNSQSHKKAPSLADDGVEFFSFCRWLLLPNASIQPHSLPVQTVSKSYNFSSRKIG